MRWAGHIAHMGERRGVDRVLVGKPERKSALGRPRSRWKVDIKMNLKELACRIDLAESSDSWRALVMAVMNIRVP